MSYCNTSIMLQSIYNFTLFFDDDHKTYKIYRDGNATDLIKFSMGYGFQWVKVYISFFTSFYVVYLMNSKYLPNNQLVLKNKDKAYELKCYRYVSYLVALVDVFYTSIGFIFWRGVQQFQQGDLNIYLNDPAFKGDKDLPCILQNQGVPFIQTGAFAYLLCESIRFGLRVFALRVLTAVNKKMKVGKAFLKGKFYFAFWIFFINAVVNFVFLGLHFKQAQIATTKDGKTRTWTELGQYKIYFPLFSEQTVSYWLIVGILEVLMIIDWKFKKEYATDNTQMWTSVTGQVNWDGLKDDIRPKPLNKEKIEMAIREKLQINRPEQIKYCAEMIISKHQKYINEYFEKLENIPAIKERKQLQHSKLRLKWNYYVQYILIYHIITIIGYLFIIASIVYREYIPRFTNFLEMIGSAISFLVTIFYELTHNLVFFHTFFITLQQDAESQEKIQTQNQHND